MIILIFIKKLYKLIITLNNMFKFTNKISIKKIICLFILFIGIPLILFFTIFNFPPYGEIEYTQSSWGEENKIVQRSLLITYNIDKENILKGQLILRSLMGGITNLPLYKTCIKINKDPSFDILSFKSEVYYNSEHTMNLFLKETDCFYIMPNYENKMYINILYSYNKSVNDFSIEDLNFFEDRGYPFSFDIQTNELRKNKNVGFFIFTIAYWVFLLFLYELYLKIRQFLLLN